MATPGWALLCILIITPVTFVMLYGYYNFIKYKPSYWIGKNFSRQFQSFMFFSSIFLYAFIFFLPKMLNQISPDPNLPSFSAASTIVMLIGLSWLMFILRRFCSNGLDKYYLGLAVAFTVAWQSQLLLVYPWLFGLPVLEKIVQITQVLPFILLVINEFTFLESNDWVFLPEDPK